MSNVSRLTASSNLSHADALFSGHDGREERRVLLGLVDVAAQRLDLLDGAESGVRLDPLGLVGPLAALVELVDDGQERVVDRLAVQDARGVVVLVVEEVVALEPVGGYFHDERLVSSWGSLLEQVVHVSVRDSRDLVDDRVVDVQAVEMSGLGGQRREVPGVVVADNAVLRARRDDALAYAPR